MELELWPLATQHGALPLVVGLASCYRSAETSQGLCEANNALP